MAKTETFTSGCSSVGGFGYADRFTLYVVLTDRDGNPSSNQSIVDYNVYLENTSGGGTFQSRTRLYFAINGSVVRDETATFEGPRNGRLQIASGSITVGHNNDGNQAISFHALVNSVNLGVSSSIQNNFSLETIPRYAEINSFSVQSVTLNSVTLQYSVSRTANIYCRVDGQLWGNPRVYNTTSGTFTVEGLSPGNLHSFVILARATDSGLDRISGEIYANTPDIARIQSANNFNIGDDASMTFSSPPSGCILRAYLERITGKNGTRIEDIAQVRTIEGTNYKFEYDNETLYSKIPNSNSGWCRYCLVTVYNGSEYGSYADREFYVTNSNPIFSNFTYADSNETIVNELTGNNQTIIKGNSNVTAIVSVANKAIPQNKATMDIYRFSIGEDIKETNYSETEDVLVTIEKAKSNVFTMYAIDSRKNSTLKQITAEKYINYEPITLNTMTVTRTNNVGSETRLFFSGNIWSGNFGLVDNEITECYYEYKKTIDVDWEKGVTDIKPTQDGNAFSFNGIIAGDLGAIGFDIEESYNIRVFVKDKLSDNYHNPLSFILGPGIPAMAIYKNKVSIGGKYDTELGGTLQITGDIYKDGYLWNRDVYSLDEVPVGTWIDGKTIYRKVFLGNIPNETNEWTNLFQLNDDIDQFVNLRGIMINTKTDGRIFPIPNYESTSYYIALSYLSQTRYVQVMLNGWTYSAFGFIYRIIIDYTKKNTEKTIEEIAEGNI